MTLKLYDFKAAPSPRRTRIFLAEKNLSAEVVQVDLASGEQLGEDYRRINPRCTVPALELDDGTVLTENVAIASYLEELSPDPRLMGTSPVERALVLEWNARAESEGFMAVAEIFRNTSKRMENRALPGPMDLAQIPELAERGHKRLTHFFDVLDERLEGREHLVGPDFTFADISALVVVDFAKWVKVTPEQHHDNLIEWFERLSQRRSMSA